MLLVVYGSLIVWSIGLVRALLLIYPSILVWYRWVGGTFNLYAVSVLSEGVNVVKLHTHWKNSPIRYKLSQNIGINH